MDFIGEKLSDNIKLNSEDPSKSEIRQFFSGKTIFLTGCTGFIGKCLVEKLLRTCSDIKRLYILVRMKKQESVEKRIEDYFNNAIFQTVRNLRPNFREQVTIIPGDLSLPGIAMSPDDRRRLTETVDVIIHNAAMVIFSAKISTLLRINVLGTKEMLDLAIECRHLKCFLYISTAYSHCYLKTIEEKFYKPPADMQIVQDMIKADTENEAGLSKEFLNDFLGAYPNAYIFTKAIAESIVQDYAKKVPFPCGVFRMSIAISTYREPIKSWCGNTNGPTFMFVAVGLGILHAIYLEENCTPDFIPADMTANACLVAVWDLVKNKKDCKEGCIYNYASGTVNKLTYESMQNHSIRHCIDYPPLKLVGVVFVLLAKSYFRFVIYHILFHYIPAIIMDLLNLVRLKKPKYLPILLRAQKHIKEIVYFSSNNWTITMDEMLRIWDEMNPADHENFFCDLRKINWDDYSIMYWYGLRSYVLNEPLDNIDAAIRRQQIIYYSTYTIMTLIMLFIGYFVFNRISFIFV